MRPLEEIANEVAKKVCPDIGHPLDPNNDMQKQAAATILSALTEATDDTWKILRDVSVNLYESETQVAELRAELERTRIAAAFSPKP